MKRLLATILALLSFGAAAQNVNQNVLTVFTSGAAYYAQTQGYTMASFTAAQMDYANQMYARSLINLTLVNSGIRSGICCGTQTSMSGPGQYEVTTNPSIGAIKWVQNSIQIATERDNTNSDIVVVYTDFQNPDDPNGVAGAVCGSGVPGADPKPSTAFIIIDIRAQLSQTPVILGHEVGHLNCMNHAQGYTRKSGTTATNCEILVTSEINPARVDRSWNPQTCWKTSSTGQCFSNPHAAIVAIATASNWQNCTYGYVSDTGSNVGATWTESMSCPFVGYANFTATYYGTTSDFQCPNVQGLRYFSNPLVTYNGAPLGDNFYNTAGIMNDRLTIAAGFRNTKLAPILKARALAAIQAQYD